MSDFDVVVIGGGIAGAAAARELARRGRRCALVERAGFGSGTTAKSSRLVHGGLRYLLHDPPTTADCCRDAGRVLRVASGHLRRMPFLWPVYADDRHGPAAVEAVLSIYDLFGPWKGGRPHAALPPAEAVRLWPGLLDEGLRAAYLFDEWAVDPVRLAQATAASARRLGAAVFENSKVSGLERPGPWELRVEGPAGPFRLRALQVLNAAGPWAAEVAGLAGAPLALRLRQGIHLVYGRRLAPGAAIFETGDGHAFLIPSEESTLVGPTDTAFEGSPDRARPAEGEAERLLRAARRRFPGLPPAERWIAGVRPIFAQRGPASLLSRDFRVFDHGGDGAPGLFSLVGGKLTTHPMMAEAAADALDRAAGRESAGRYDSLDLEERPLPSLPESPPGPGRVRVAAALAAAYVKRLLKGGAPPLEGRRAEERAAA